MGQELTTQLSKAIRADSKFELKLEALDCPVGYSRYWTIERQHGDRLINLLHAFTFYSLEPVFMPKLIATYSKPICGLAWSKKRLLIFTQTRVEEWPTGRKSKLAVPAELDPYGSEEPARFWLQYNANRTRALAKEFVIDLSTLKSIKVQAPPGADSYPIWIGNELATVQGVESEDCVLIRKGRRIQIAKGKYVAGVSANGEFALVNDKAPFDGNDTYLVRINRSNGKCSTLQKFPKSSDDHNALESVDYNWQLNRWLILSNEDASGFEWAFEASPKLRKIGLSRLIGDEISCRLDWIRSGSAWTLAFRMFFSEFENGLRGFDARSFDLYNVKTKEVIRLSSQINWWRWNGDEEQADRLGRPELSIGAIDWDSKRFAFVIQTTMEAKIFTVSFGNSIR